MIVDYYLFDPLDCNVSLVLYLTLISRKFALNTKNKKKNDLDELSNNFNEMKAEYDEKRKFIELLELYKQHTGKEFVSKKVFNE